MKNEKTPVTQCTVCNEDLYDCDEAFAVIGGHMDKSIGGFFEHEERPYLAVMCVDCWRLIRSLNENIRKRVSATRSGSHAPLKKEE